MHPKADCATRGKAPALSPPLLISCFIFSVVNQEEKSFAIGRPALCLQIRDAFPWWPQIKGNQKAVGRGGGEGKKPYLISVIRSCT